MIHRTIHKQSDHLRYNLLSSKRKSAEIITSQVEYNIFYT